MSSTYTIETLDEASVEGAATVIATEFGKRQISSDFDTSAEKFKEYLTYCARESASQKLGYIARCNETSEVVGTVITCDLADTLSSEDFLKEVENDPWISMLYEINKEYFGDTEVQKGEYLNVKFLAVSEAWSGQGIVNKLLGKALDNAKKLGFKYGHTEAAGNISQHIFMNRFGFEEKNEIKYEEFIFKGVKLFSATETHQSIKLLIKAL